MEEGARLLLKEGAACREADPFVEPLKPPCEREPVPTDCELPAQGGRSDRFIRAACAEPPAGLLDWPKPRGAWPRSVVLPCAAQVRVPLLARWGTLLLCVLLIAPGMFRIDDGGLLLANCRWRAVIASVLDIVVEWPVPAGEFGETARWLAVPFIGRFVVLFTGALPVWPTANRLVLMVRTGI
jgi:hypothetical protein